MRAHILRLLRMSLNTTHTCRAAFAKPVARAWTCYQRICENVRCRTCSHAAGENLREYWWPKYWRLHWVYPLHKKNCELTAAYTEICKLKTAQTNIISIFGIGNRPLTIKLHAIFISWCHPTQSCILSCFPNITLLPQLNIWKIVIITLQSIIAKSPSKNNI